MIPFQINNLYVRIRIKILFDLQYWQLYSLLEKIFQQSWQTLERSDTFAAAKQFFHNVAALLYKSVRPSVGR